MCQEQWAESFITEYISWYPSAKKTNVVLPSVIFVSPELCSERDYVITHSVCSMYVCVCGIFAKLITVSTYIDVFPWDLDTMILV